ncbi:MAG: hypothetical protein QOF51_2825 [Chloroflexota bacterium]|nr:hypothetical protein [Chloroflexota bacterium]
MAKTKRPEATYRIVSEEEGRAIFDAEARKLMNVSGEEWVRRYDAGEYDDDPRHEEIVELSLLLPFFRRVP